MISKKFSTKIKDYYLGIDSLRAIAVLLVLFHHYFNQKITDYLQLGNLGVDVFFTISGFLISGILFSYKEKLNFRDALRIFYGRRILRIFPIYYLYIGVVIIIFHNEISHSLIFWTSIFCENFYIISGGKSEWVFAHFWSLAVEEQFYLIWPFLIFLTKRKFTKSLIVIFIVVSFLFSLINAFIFKVPFVEYMHPLSCFLALAIGAFVKYMSVYESNSLIYLSRNSIKLFMISMLLWICVLVIFNYRFSFLFPFLRLFASLSTAFLLLRIMDKPKYNWIDNILYSSLLMRIGKISYGIYVYHLIVKVILDPIISGIVYQLTSPKNLLRYNVYIITLPLYSLITIGIASISFNLFEIKINGLKDRLFPQGITVQKPT